MFLGDINPPRFLAITSLTGFVQGCFCNKAQSWELGIHGDGGQHTLEKRQRDGAGNALEINHLLASLLPNRANLTKRKKKFLVFRYGIASIIWQHYLFTRRLLAGGPSGRLWALRALTSSFAPFGRSGHVTHATLIG